MEISRDNIVEILKRTDIHPSKDYGQNFLIEPNISKQIVDGLEINSKDYILEIGPGLGSLTHFLSLNKNDVDVVDIDLAMTDWLNVIYKENKNIKIITNDVRKIDVSNYTKVIANLPYNITTELLVYLLSNAASAKRMVLMCQTETFAHFNDLKGSEYGPTSVLVHLLGDIKKLLVVKAGSFLPTPKCTSTVFVIDLFEKKNRNEIISVYKFSKALFLNRRKTLINNLSNYLGNKEKAKAMLRQLDISENVRPEELSPDTYFDLYKLL